jgi:hypothetical protein
MADHRDHILCRYLEPTQAKERLTPNHFRRCLQQASPLLRELLLCAGTAQQPRMRVPYLPSEFHPQCCSNGSLGRELVGFAQPEMRSPLSPLGAPDHLKGFEWHPRGISATRPAQNRVANPLFGVLKVVVGIRGNSTKFPHEREVLTRSLYLRQPTEGPRR